MEREEGRGGLEGKEGRGGARKDVKKGKGRKVMREGEGLGGKGLREKEERGRGKVKR